MVGDRVLILAVFDSPLLVGAVVLIFTVFSEEIDGGPAHSLGIMVQSPCEAAWSEHLIMRAEVEAILAFAVGAGVGKNQSVVLPVVASVHVNNFGGLCDISELASAFIPEPLLRAVIFDFVLNSQHILAIFLPGRHNPVFSAHISTNS